MTIEKIKPIPKYIEERIHKADIKAKPLVPGQTRFYAYLTRQGNELVHITVAVRNWKKKDWYCKQVVAHGVHTKECLIRDIEYYNMSGYVVDWSREIPGARSNYWRYDWSICSTFDFKPYAPIVNMEYMEKFPEYKYSQYDKLQGWNLLPFLRQYEKYPVVEFLMKFGYTSFWDSKQICTLATKDKKFRKWLAQNKDVKGIDHCYVASIVNAYRNGREILEQDNVERIKKIFMQRDLKELRQAYKGEQEKILSYVHTQKTTLYSYKDYYLCCTKLGLDMTDSKNRYPHDFRYWHDIRTDQWRTKQAELDAEKKKQFYDRFAKIAEKYLGLERMGKEYVILIPHSPKDLIEEGQALHHCVGRMNYDQKMVQEQSLIFFVRKATDTETPLATLEYSTKTHRVLQLHGIDNTNPEEKLQKFVYNNWLPYANKQIRRIAA